MNDDALKELRANYIADPERWRVLTKYHGFWQLIDKAIEHGGGVQKVFDTVDAAARARITGADERSVMPDEPAQPAQPKKESAINGVGDFKSSQINGVGADINGSRTSTRARTRETETAPPFESDQGFSAHGNEFLRDTRPHARPSTLDASRPPSDEDRGATVIDFNRRRTVSVRETDDPCGPDAA